MATITTNWRRGWLSLDSSENLWRAKRNGSNTQRMGHFLAANGVTTEERKHSIFLSVVGPKTYKLLCSLVSPNKPEDKSIAELVQALKSHYNPEPSEIVERYKFHTRFRKPGESVATFVSELRTLAQTCTFGDSLGDMFRDRLVCGIK